MSSSRAELSPLADDDADAVAALAREVEAEVGYRVATTADDVRAWWRGVSLDRDGWTIRTDSKLVAAGWLMVNDRTAYQWGHVLPSALGRGFGSLLLARCEERARELGLAKVRAGALGADAAAGGLLRAHGYEPANRYLELAVELDGPPEPFVAAGIAVQPFRPEDARVFHRTIDEAFAENWDFVSTPFEEWHELRVANGDMSYSFLAREGDTVAGAIRCEPDRRGLGWVATLGVLPPWRGRGVGRALLLHAFRAFWDGGQPNVGLGVAADNDAALRLYESVGLRVEAEDVVYEKRFA